MGHASSIEVRDTIYTALPTNGDAKDDAAQPDLHLIPQQEETVLLRFTVVCKRVVLD